MIEKLKQFGYNGEFNLSLIIDWIRINKNFYIWVEHGVIKKDGTRTHDLTVSGDGRFSGCLRGSYLRYEDAQKRGIEIFIDYYIVKKSITPF
jgi:hypothetical protein